MTACCRSGCQAPQRLAVGGLLDRGTDAQACALVAGISQTRQPWSCEAAQYKAASMSRVLRAQVRSCRCPGRASQVQIGSPSGRMMAWMFLVWCLPEYQAWMVSPLTLGGDLGSAGGR